MKTFGWKLRMFNVKQFIFVLILSGSLQNCDAKVHRSLTELQPGNDEYLESLVNQLPEGGDQLDAEEGGHSNGHLLQTPNDRLGFCNETTVSRLTPYHFQILESGMHVYRCWAPRIGRLMSLLRQEQSRGDGRGRSSQRLSANEGYRLRCRILFKFDTCRSNFAKYWSMDNPDILTEWPEEILQAINNDSP